ncbi:Insulin receptor tyrosine kinase substrate [Gryllus bimaculatus]|nr:Insulin receptor tyrosine kinase substrate [Gryllus bimaculatus]
MVSRRDGTFEDKGLAVHCDLRMNILDKFNPGARQLIQAGKAYLKALHGVTEAGRGSRWLRLVSGLTVTQPVLRQRLRYHRHAAPYDNRPTVPRTALHCHTPAPPADPSTPPSTSLPTDHKPFPPFPFPLNHPSTDFTIDSLPIVLTVSTLSASPLHHHYHYYHDVSNYNQHYFYWSYH